MKKFNAYKKKRRINTFQKQLQYYNYVRIKSRRKNKLDKLDKQDKQDKQPKLEIIDDLSEKVEPQPLIPAEQKVSTTSKENFLRSFNGNYNINSSGTFRSNYKSL